VSVYSAFHNATVDGVPDPRVPLQNTGARGVNGFTPMWNQLKYTSLSSPIPIARWAEAQLIIAEVEGGQEAVQIINTLRARHGLPAFSSNDPQEIRNQVIQERLRELFLEGHHLGDLIRYNLPLDPAPGQPFGNGGLYGDMRCMPLPDVERLNNPNIGR
jgi:starch-binding outer membrane protein, SusD/RagB family